MSAVKEPKWRADAGVVVRTPLLPLTMFAEWAASPDPAAYLANVLAQPEVDEAIYVASPGLHGQIAKWREKPNSAAGQRIERSLCKYVARMAGRSTPFGLFSGVSTGVLGRETKIELAPRSEYRRRTRVDNDYLFVLAGDLVKQPELLARLELRPNTSLYRIAGRLRYAAAKLDGVVRSYHLVSAELTPYLDATLERAQNGARLEQLAAPLVDDDITIDEARAFISELVEAQILVPELGIFVTGPEPIDGLIAQLRDASETRPMEVLTAARDAIATIDANGLRNPTARYEAIATSLEQLGAKVDPARLFQVDMVKPAGVTIGNRVASDIANAIEKLGRVSRSKPQAFDTFKQQFRDRYEDREIPLTEALDEESGIGFEVARGPGSEGSPLLAGIGFPGGAADSRIEWRPIDRHLFKRLAEALAANASEIELTDKDFEAMRPDPRPPRMPDCFATMVRLETLPDGEVAVMFEGGSGPSGAKLLGRFCHLSPEIDAIVRKHHAAEEAHAPDAIFAEVVHLNEGRIGNILCRPVLRAHEIVYLGVSGAPREQQITLDDVMVSVRGERVVLRSKRLNKEILPRLTTAHNFRLRSLGVYRFLCALADQTNEHVFFRWGPLQSAPFLPRLRYGRIILSRATWQLDATDLEQITATVREAGKNPAAQPKVLAAVAALREARKLPRYLVIAAGDNELPIDLDNPLLAAAFADECAGSDQVQLEEMFPHPDKLVAHGPEGRFANEAVLLFSREPTPPSTQPAATPARTRSSVKVATETARRFVPGSEWLYGKIYCGEATVDHVLRDAIAPLVREHAGDFDRWFFIRYGDPDWHLRVRFHGEPAALAGSLLPALERSLAPLFDAGMVRKLVLDSYERETERYGGDRGIELVEQIFWRDAECVLNIVELLSGDEGADARWRLTLRGIDSLLEALGLDEAARDRVATNGREMIGREVNADTAFWGRIGDRFTKERASLELLVARDPARDAGHDLEPGFELLAKRDALVKEIGAELRRRDAAGELRPGVDEMAWSIVHMHANRLIHASARAHEVVLYDFLRRLYAAKRARSKGKPAAESGKKSPNA